MDFLLNPSMNELFNVIAKPAFFTLSLLIWC